MTCLVFFQLKSPARTFRWAAIPLDTAGLGHLDNQPGLDPSRIVTVSTFLVSEPDQFETARASSAWDPVQGRLVMDSFAMPLWQHMERKAVRRDPSDFSDNTSETGTDSSSYFQAHNWEWSASLRTLPSSLPTYEYDEDE